MTKKVVSVALVIITIFSTLIISVNAASYKTGNYAIASSSGSNVRSGAGTGYSKVGAASKGVTFTVSKVNGNWGYTSSIKCTNGTKAGWVCLDYCTYKDNSTRTTYNDVFASTKGSGYSLAQAKKYQATSFTKGTFIYIWAYFHDANDNLYKTYSTRTCNMTITIYRPDGSKAHSYTYKNSDNNWIGQNLDQVGTWKIQSKISGALSGTNTRTITVKEASKTTYYTLSYNANGGSGVPSSQRVKAATGFYLSNTKPTRSGYTFLGWSTSKTASTASYAPGAGVRISSNITLYAVWKKNTANSTYYTLSYNANGGSGAPSSQRVKAATGFYLSNTKPTRSGYTFLGWSTSKTASTASYAPGAGVRISSNITLYAVWKKNPVNNTVKLNVPMFKQGDSRWANTYIGSKTIGQVGCLTTSIAMVYSYNTGTTTYPNTMKNKLSFSNNDLYWSSLSKVGLTSTVYNCGLSNSMLSTIYSKLKAGKPVIIGATTQKGGSQHWVVITGYNGNSTTNFSTANFLVNDPGVQGSTTLKAFLANGSQDDRTRILRIIY